MDFDQLTALLDRYDTGDVTKANMLAQIKLHADERVAAERERCAKVCEARSRCFSDFSDNGEREQLCADVIRMGPRAERWR